MRSPKVFELLSNRSLAGYLKRVVNKDLLYSTGSSAQCRVAAWMGRKFQGECVCMAGLPKQVKNPSANAWDASSVPESGRSPGERHGKPLQYSCLENPMTEEPGRLQPMGSQSDLARICIAKSLHCPSEAITTLLISYTPIQNKEFEKKRSSWAGTSETFKAPLCTVRE